ncbi:hypothetical protein FN846DRAFT_906763 [Sphaerosporella brunnea]|uniref:RNase H type-1 domain-containing protein n=1 Tax=Sphaerosporella brunnea TaxID=1250544 RepID=A0A5J5EY14_9PEZI|nr:hypothetical protein FN846DRAFT_906763 [Sphaerosporella brunnea]
MLGSRQRKRFTQSADPGTGTPVEVDAEPLIPKLGNKNRDLASDVWDHWTGLVGENGVHAHAAIRRLQDTGPGPGQWIVAMIARAESAILDAGWTVEFRWTTGHKDVPGNEQADGLAKEAASRQFASEPPKITVTASLAYVARAVMSAKRP